MHKRIMAKNFKILYVAAEIKPFLNHSYVSEIVRKLPQAMQEKGIEIRILVPKFGCINERKNRLHEVVRLSGMNIPIGDDEKPLIIKVASIPAAKLQVYFIDNEDYFQRKTIFHKKNGKFHNDNDERCILLCTQNQMWDFIRLRKNLQSCASNTLLLCSILRNPLRIILYAFTINPKSRGVLVFTRH